MSAGANQALVRPTSEALELRKQFSALLDKTNKDNPSQDDIQALRELLSENRGLELWRRVHGIARLSEDYALQNARIPAGLKEVWKHRLTALRAEHGYADASIMERLLIHQVVLCWLRLNLTEMSYTDVLSESATVAKALFWERRLSAVQKRYFRACESLARLRKLSHYTPSLQFNIATKGGQQINVAG